MLCSVPKTVICSSSSFEKNHRFKVSSVTHLSMLFSFVSLVSSFSVLLLALSPCSRPLLLPRLENKVGQGRNFTTCAHEVDPVSGSSTPEMQSTTQLQFASRIMSAVAFSTARCSFRPSDVKKWRHHLLDPPRWPSSCVVPSFIRFAAAHNCFKDGTRRSKFRRATTQWNHIHEESFKIVKRESRTIKVGFSLP